MRIIVNADDLGISREVNDRIFDLMRRRRITSATILANGPACEEIGEFRDLPNCSFGVHLNITEFLPLTSKSDLKPLLDEYGAFCGDDHARAIRFDSPLKRAIEEEWSAQIQRVISLGVPVSHLDSHHHMHTHPPLFGSLKLVQRRFKVRKVRISQNIYTKEELGGRKLHLIKKALWNGALRTIYSTTTTAAFTKFSSFCALHPDLSARFRDIELMVHPGHSYPEFVEEIAQLELDWMERLGPCAKLISYREL